MTVRGGRARRVYYFNTHYCCRTNGETRYSKYVYTVCTQGSVSRWWRARFVCFLLLVFSTRHCKHLNHYIVLRRLFEYYYMYYSLAAHRRYSPSPHRVPSRNPAPRASGGVKYDIGAFAARETWEFINSIKIVIEHVSGWCGTELPSVHSGGGRTQTFSRLSARAGERNIL